MYLYGLFHQSLGSATTEGVLHMVESGLKSANVGVRTGTLHALLSLLQQPPHLPTPVPDHITTTTPDKTGTLRLLQEAPLTHCPLRHHVSH